jgi:anti-sigma regulatory factor (Ser/Thr protein kinase)
MNPDNVLEISSAVDQLALVRRFLRDFCSKYTAAGFDEDHMAQLELAVNEATANIMKHAYQGQENQIIRLEATAEKGRVMICLLHNGHSFSPETVPPPSFDGSRSGGFGVFLIRECVDEVRYLQTSEGLYCIYLMKIYPE